MRSRGVFAFQTHKPPRANDQVHTGSAQNTQGWGRTLEHLYIHIGTPAPASTAASLPTRRSCSLRNLPRRARAREHAHTPVLQPTCTPPRRTQQRVWARARAPPPLPPWASHAGGSVELTLKQICFRAKRGSAIRVQSFDDSLNSAIRTTYRISLRSSSLREPRYPLLEVVWIHIRYRRRKPFAQYTHKQPPPARRVCTRVRCVSEA